MAVVDFSHAVLDVNSGNVLTHGDYLDLGASGTLYNSRPSEVAYGNVSILSNTPSKVSLLYTGTFNSNAGTGSTEFYIGLGSGNALRWKVSNISFSSGDTYSFIIDIEVEGNT